MNNYTVGDFIIRFKNAVMANRRTVVFSYSKLTKAMAALLVKEGYLKNVREEDVEGRKALVADIAFLKRMATFTDVTLISKPSLRVYADIKDIEKQSKKGLGILVISTSMGLLTGKEALKNGVGGELLFKIW